MTFMLHDTQESLEKYTKMTQDDSCNHWLVSHNNPMVREYVRRREHYHYYGPDIRVLGLVRPAWGGLYQAKLSGHGFYGRMVPIGKFPLEVAMRKIEEAVEKMGVR